MSIQRNTNNKMHVIEISDSPQTADLTKMTKRHGNMCAPCVFFIIVRVNLVSVYVWRALGVQLSVGTTVLDEK